MDHTERKLRVGILGVGPIAQIAHLPALLKAYNVHLLAACDVSTEVLNAVVNRYQISRAYTHTDQFLADDDIEAIVISVAISYHTPLTLAALRAGKHVLVEKPLASTVAECEELVQTAHQTGRQLQIGCMKRFDHALESAQRFVHEAMGQPFLVSGWSYDSKFHAGYGGAYVRSLNVPLFESQDQLRHPPQRQYSDPVLRKLLGHGIHIIDLLRFFGGDIVAVAARSTSLPQATTWISLIEYASGASGTFTMVDSVQMDWSEGLHIHGENGSIIAHIPFPYGKELSNVQIFDSRTSEYRKPTSPDLDQYKRQIEAFADAILHQRSVSPNGEDGLAAEKVLYALYASICKDGERVPIV